MITIALRVVMAATAGSLVVAVTSRAQEVEPTASVRGVVFDSLAGRPLAGAIVQLLRVGDGVRDTTVIETRAGRADSLGQYYIPRLTAGRYLAGFFHAVLDSLGFASAPRELVMDQGGARLDLAIPSASTLVRAVCPEHLPSTAASQPGANALGVLVGHVRASDTEELRSGATIAAEWIELVQEAVLVKPHVRRAAAETTKDGWFALCGLPPDIPIILRAVHGADSSGYVRLTMPAGGLRHQPFYVGPVHQVVLASTEGRALTQALVPAAADSPARGRIVSDSLAGRERVVLTAWRGSGRIIGTVTDERNRPLSGAQATVWRTGLEARTGPRGTFVLDSLPAGTHTLEVRALGYAPVQRVVHLVNERPIEVTVSLARETVSLPTVAVRAREERTVNIRLDHFYQRMRDAEKGINHGYFITPEDLERRRPAFVTQMLDGIPGVHVGRSPHAPVAAKGMVIYGRPGDCIMTVYLDGQRVFPPGLDRLELPTEEHLNIDAFIDAHTLAAIEVYPRPVMAPPQYQSLNGSCGIVLLWSK